MKPNAPSVNVDDWGFRVVPVASTNSYIRLDMHESIGVLEKRAEEAIRKDLPILWKCEYCGTVMDIVEHKTCKSCGQSPSNRFMEMYNKMVGMQERKG